MRTTEERTRIEGERERERRARNAHVQRRFVGPNHLCSANRLFPTFLQHAKLVSGPIYPRPVSAIHTEHEKSTTKAIHYNCIVQSPVKRPIVAVVLLSGVGVERCWRGESGGLYRLLLQ